jgi:aryl-alcohol dehydrogenase-like predicted oxidoreductase
MGTGPLGLAHRDADEAALGTADPVSLWPTSWGIASSGTPSAVDQGVGVLVWGPLGGGLLSGRYQRDAPPPARRGAGWTEPPVRDEQRLYDVVDAVVGIAAGRGCGWRRWRCAGCCPARR